MKSCLYFEDGGCKGGKEMKKMVGNTKTKQVEEELKAERNRLEAVTKAMEWGLTIHDLDYNIIYQNDVIKDKFGDRLGEKCYKVYEDEDKICSGCPVEMTIKDGKPHTAERKITIPSGETVFLENATYPIRNTKGEIVSCIEISKNITERKKMEEAFRGSEKKYSYLIEHAADGIAIIQDGVFKLVNSALVGMSGYDKEELLGMLFIKLLTPECQKLVAARYQDRLTGKGIPPVYEAKAVTKAGGVRDIEINAALTEYEGLAADEVIIRDITERKKVEEALRFSDTAFRSIQEGVVATDTEYTITHWNKVSEKIYGIEASKAIGKSLFDVIEIVENSPGEIAGIFKKVEIDGFYQGEWLNRTKNAEVWVKVSVQAMEANGKRYGWVTLITDITERKKAEDREKKLRQELDVAGRLASIGEMASGIAHEINNPLTGVIGFAQLLMNRDIPDDVREDLKVINDEAQRVAKIVAGLLTFAHQHKPGRGNIDINEIILEVLKLRSYEMQVNNIKVVPQLAPDLPQTTADGNQLQQVFLNVILNAEQAMVQANGGGNLSIRTEKVNDSIRVSLADDGPGISKENLDKIFNPFFTTRGVGQGTGLGLSICHGIITQHKGRIYAQSELGKGATFVVELPIVVATDDTEREGKPKVTEEETPRREGAKVLVVDDETAILTFLNRLLAEWGYEVETVDNANDALDRLGNGKYSLILLDIKLPGMSGTELYHRIEAIDPALTRRVMFITGDVMETTTRNFLEKTNALYIAKPVNIEQLKSNINHILTGELVK
jgi:PAS domain S-box-containing protein